MKMAFFRQPFNPQWSTLMNPVFRKLALTAVIALGIAATSTAVLAAPVSQEIIEARQETQIWTTYALSPYLRASDIQVAVHGDKATLTGKVDEDVNKDLAKQIALGVRGIKEVDNQILVVGDYVAPAHPAERSFGEVVDDASIKAAVKAKLLWSKHTRGLDTDVDIRRGRVTLSGTADSAAAKALATRLTLNTRGVVSVNNQLRVDANAPSGGYKTKAAAKEVGHDFADGWITAKIKSTYVFSSNVESSDIAVDTKDGVVTLSGKVSSGAERALAIEFAENIRGVKSVNATALTSL